MCIAFDAYVCTIEGGPRGFTALIVIGVLKSRVAQKTTTKFNVTAWLR